MSQGNEMSWLKGMVTSLLKRIEAVEARLDGVSIPEEVQTDYGILSPNTPTEIENTLLKQANEAIANIASGKWVPLTRTIHKNGSVTVEHLLVDRSK